MSDFARALAASPELYPFRFDEEAERMLFIRLNEAGYAEASFLDERILTPATQGEWIGWADVAAASAMLPDCAPHFIFHIGHVGSTLLSRLLGAHPGVFALREPLPLRTAARMQQAGDARGEDRLSTLCRLWARTWRPGQKSVVKATSFASSLAATLLERHGEMRAIALTVTPPTYLATILGAPNSPVEIRNMAPERLRRLEARLGLPASSVESLSLGELTAMSWTVEMLALRDAARAHGERMLWLDFDRLLAAPAAALSAALARFGVTAETKDVEAILNGPIPRRYAKAPEHGYDAQLRAQVLAQARGGQGLEIARGMAWLQTMAAHAPVREALEFAARLSRA